MGRYIATRLLSLVIVLVGISIVAFAVVQLVPGDTATSLLGPEASSADVDALRARLGLDQPIWVQYWRWLSDVVRGDLGGSIRFGVPVTELLGDRLVNTLILGGAALTIAIVLGVTAGIISSTRPGSLVDRLVMLFALFGNSMPTFWLGLLFISFFSVGLGVLPAGGIYDVRVGPSLGQTIEHLVLPALTLGLVSAGIVARLTRSAMLEVLGQDYLRTARAKGAREANVVWRHALRNAALPVITIIGAQAGFLISGAVLTETVFAWPGLGLLVFEAITTRDIPVIQGALLVSAAAFALINLIVDLLYTVLDPRVTYARTT